MKILHIGKYYPPFHGGIENVNYDLVEGIANKGYEIDVLVINHNNEDHPHKKKYRVIRKNLLCNIFSQPVSFSYLLEILTKSKKYDIVHIHLPNPLATLPLFFLRLKKTKMVLHWHCDIVEQKLMHFLYSPLEYLILKKARTVVTTSGNYAKSSKVLKKFASKTTTVPIGIDNLKVLRSSPILDKIRNQNPGKQFVFGLGRLVRYKGFKFLVEASKSLNDDTLVVIGGKGPLENELKEIIVKNNLEKKVFLVGRIPDNELGYFFQQCSIFCFPSITKNEAFGVSQLEAMAFGKPIVSTNIPGSGVSWVNKNMESGLIVPPMDSQSISKAINTLLDDKKLYGELSKGAKKRFEEQFTKDKMVDDFIELYQDLQAD